MKNFIDGKKLEKFYKYLDIVSLSKKEKNDIKFLIKFLRGRASPELSNKTFMLYGDPGLGKTFLVENIISTTKDMKILYLGCAKISHPNIVFCKDLQDLQKTLEKTKDCIAFIDDLRYVADYDSGELEDIERKSLMKILEHVKKSKDQTIFLSTLNSLTFDEAIYDRIEIRIRMETPSEENRESFLKKNYNHYISRGLVKYLNNRLIGYNYRELPELIKIAYREGNGRIDRKSLKTALREHTPSSMMGYPLIKGINLKFKDLIGRKKEKRMLNSVIKIIKKPELARKYGLKRNNVIVIHGPHGTGKSYMARALTGELDYMLLDYSASDFYRFGPLHGVNRIMRIAKRFKNCVIFIDEAGKLFGRRRMEFESESGPVIGEFNRLIEGAGEDKIESLIIFATNHLHRFPKSLLERVTTLELKLPNKDERADFMIKVFRNTEVRGELDIDHLSDVTEGLSFRDLEKTWRDAVNESLNKNEEMTTKLFEQVITERKGESEPKRADYMG